MALPGPDVRIAIGDWRFDRTSFELERVAADGSVERKRLPHTPGLLLSKLAERPGGVVTRDELIASVWQRRGVSDQVLSRTVNLLRSELGDDARNPRFVETIPKVGYRLVVEGPDFPVPLAPGAGSVVAESAARPADADTARLSRVSQDASTSSRGGLAAASVVIVAIAALAWWSSQSARRTGPDELPTLDPATERPVTSAAGYEVAPALDPTGKWLAYVEVSEDESQSELVLVERDGTARRTIETSKPPRNSRPAFSPDGTRLAYRRFAGERCSIVVRAVHGGDGEEVATCDAVSGGGLAFSHDGARIAYTAPGTTPHDAPLAELDLATRTTRVLTSPGEIGPDVDPRYVPGDAATISFARGLGSERDVLLLDTAEPQRAPTVLVRGPDRIDGHAWTPDGRFAVVATDSPGFRALILVERATGQRRVLPARGGRYPVVGPDGRVVYEAARFDANLWQVAFDGGAARKLDALASTTFDASPAIAPDGRTIAFISLRDGTETAYLGTIDGPARRLPLDPDKRWVRPSFHPDGTQLLLTAYSGGKPAVYRYEVDSERTFELHADGHHRFGAQFLGDGRRMVYSTTDNRLEPASLVIETVGEPGSARVVDGTNGVDEFRAGRDFIAFTTVGKPVIRVVGTEPGDTPRRLVSILPASRFAWAATPTAVHFLRRVPGSRSPGLFSIDVATREVRFRTFVAPNFDSPSLAVAPAQDYAVFARVDHVAIDLMEARLVDN